MQQWINRRWLLERLGAAGLGAGAIFLTRGARAQDELPQLPVNNELAVALKYTEDATTADGGETTRADGEFCHNCRYFQGEDGQTDGYAGCQIFPEFRVAAAGWCNTWVELAQ